MSREMQAQAIFEAACAVKKDGVEVYPEVMIPLVGTVAELAIRSFMPEYIEKKIVPRDPFATIDAEGLGQLVRMGTEKGRMTNPKLKVGVCGEHGGDPDSITPFRSVGLDYVSCSPFRVPVARLAAAQAELGKRIFEG
jgi:phosphoenolpyruvate synthase/pyruvate phosphate dikinase